jgi:fibronectin type 3 domain-containing protein
MKNAIRVFGIIALVAVIGFSMTACPPDGDEGGGGNGNGSHTHSYGSVWKSNATQHWHECSCGDYSDVANHSGNPCTVCGYNSSGGGSTPSVPTGVSATAQSSSSIRITWNSVSGATSYDVYYEVGSSSTKNFAGNTSSTSYTHTGLTASTTYNYYIKAKNSSGESGYSSFASARTQSGSGGGGTAPSTPTGVTATAISSSSITVSWNSVSNVEFYNIYRSSSMSGTYTWIMLSSSTSYTDTGLSANTTYYYKVSAENDNGESSRSITTGYATTLSSGGGGSTPSAPTGVTASRNPAGSTTVRITWNAVSGATSYRVYYSSTGSGSGSLEGSPSTTSFDSTNNNTTATHYFRVAAVNSAGEGTPSSWVSVGPVSGGGGTNGSVTIVNNSSRTIRNFTLYQSGYSILNGTGFYFYSATIEPGSSATWTNAPPGSYVRIGSDTYLGYKVDKNTSFTVTAGQTTTVTINSSDVVAN